MKKSSINISNKKINEKNKIKKIIIVMIFIIGIINSINFVEADELRLLSPKERYYETNEHVEKLRINLDYFNPLNETWLIINNQRIDLRKENLVEILREIEIMEVNNQRKKLEFNPISNYLEYSFSIVMTGRGTAQINLTGDSTSFGIKYFNDWNNEIWQCHNGTDYVTIGEALRNTRYNFIIKAFREGLRYTHYEVWINQEKKGTCFIPREIKSIENINIDVKGTSAKMSNQILRSGSYFIELPSGKHRATLFARDNENEIKITRDFFVVIRGCGNLICDGNKDSENCPSDCKEIICRDDALVGDTNQDNIIDELDRRNLVNMIEGRIPIPERNCCVDLNNDGIVDEKDLIIMDKIISGEIKPQQCFTGCNDGTLDQTCSINKPYFCDYGNMFLDCKTCGCPEDSVCMDDGSCFFLKNCKCGDIASRTENPLDYDNIIDELDLNLLKQNIGLCEGDDNFNEKFDLNYDGCIDERDIKCIEYNFNKTTLCAGPLVCRDGTLPNQCSKTLPFFCDEDILIYDCDRCGCPTYMNCRSDGSCGTLGNFDIILINESINKNSIHLSITQNSYKNIEFIILPHKDLHNVTFRIRLNRNNLEFNNLQHINTELSRRILLEEGIEKKISIRLEDNDNILGTYEGRIDILINGYEFHSIPLEINLRERISRPFAEFIERINIIYLIAYLFIILGVLFLIIFIIRIRRRERRLIKKLEMENNIILK